MDKQQAIDLGSRTAKGGFANEDSVVSKFNNWEHDADASQWLSIMGYDLSQIEYVKAVKLHGYKTDVQVQVTIKLKEAIDCQNLQVKLISNPKGFNQVDKRWVDRYVEMWDIPAEICELLKLYTGETKDKLRAGRRNSKRMFADEFTEAEQAALLSWLSRNKTLIVSDLLKGRGQFAAEWILVIDKSRSAVRWVLKPINICMNHFGNGDVSISPRGSFKIGHITMQRKGGDGGRDTANMLQFKINPSELFNL